MVCFAVQLNSVKGALFLQQVRCILGQKTVNLFDVVLLSQLNRLRRERQLKTSGSLSFIQVTHKNTLKLPTHTKHRSTTLSLCFFLHRFSPSIYLALSLYPYLVPLVELDTRLNGRLHQIASSQERTHCLRTHSNTHKLCTKSSLSSIFFLYSLVLKTF